jgi:hypothetical protein
VSYVLPAYIVIFAILSVASIAYDATTGEDPRWALRTELAASALATAGMVVFWFGWRPDLLVLIWRPVSIAIALAYLVLLVRDLGVLTKEETPSKPTPLWLFVTGLLASATLVLPAISLNIHYAFF